MKLAIGNDHSAVEMKKEIKKYLEDKGIEVIDVGTNSTESFNYPISGYKVGKMVANGEVDGKDYHFLSRERFVELRDQGHFAEWAEVHGNFYGTPLPPVREMLAKGQAILFDIDVQGAAQLRKNMPDARFLFILPPSIEALEWRLHHRGTDSEQTITRRLLGAGAEMSHAPEFEYVIINEDFETALSQMQAVVVASRLAFGQQAVRHREQFASLGIPL